MCRFSYKIHYMSFYPIKENKRIKSLTKFRMKKDIVFNLNEIIRLNDFQKIRKKYCLFIVHKSILYKYKYEKENLDLV